MYRKAGNARSAIARVFYGFVLGSVIGGAAIGATATPEAGPPPAVRPEDPADVMRRVAAAYARSSRGVVGVRSHSLLTIKAPIFHRRIADDGWFVFVDGELARSSARRDPRQPPLRDPYRAAYVRDYAFSYVPCPDCAAGTLAIGFSSASHDVEHASGRLVIEAATGAIVSQTERPYKLPWPTQDGELVAMWGAAAGGWFPLAISGDFAGRIGPFTGHATYAQSLSSYGRYASVEKAAAALARSAPQPPAN